MSISYLKIENYKSIKNVFMNVTEINALVGVNGSGKSNVISAICYFYDNLIKKCANDNYNIYNINNTFSNEARITIGYNMGELKKRCYENLKKANGSRYEAFYRDVTNLKDYFEITMVCVKNKGVVWNKSFAERKLIYSLFPVYMIDTRKVNLIDWENLWFQIGDLGKLDEKTGKEFRETIKGTLVGYSKTQKIYSRIEKLFDVNNTKINKFSPKQMAGIMAKMYFGGEEFKINENSLVYFSDGINSYNYIKTFIQLLAILNEIKMKEPLIILDEPEISLHHNLIDELSQVILNHCNSLDFILSTHSTRLIKNLLISKMENSFIYQVKKKNGYSVIYKTQSLCDKREQIVVTDQHVNAYFSKMIVCVEGITEVEVLKNRFLQLIYPILSKVDVMNGMADDVERKIVSPSERKYETPILYTVDMDKIFTFEVKTKKVKPVNKIKLSGEKYNYTYRRNIIKYLSKTKESIEKKCNINFRMPLFYSNDPYFENYIQIIKRYYSFFDYYVMDTTIEGALITSANLFEFRSYVKFEGNKDGKKKKRYIEVENRLTNSTEREILMAYRILYNGKSDLLFQLKDMKKNNPNINVAGVKELYGALEETFAKKTDGWVSRWLEYFICGMMSISPYESDTYIKAQNVMNSAKAEEIRQLFKFKFPEIDKWIAEMTIRLKGE